MYTKKTKLFAYKKLIYMIHSEATDLPFPKKKKQIQNTIIILNLKFSLTYINNTLTMLIKIYYSCNIVTNKII